MTDAEFDVVALLIDSAFQGGLTDEEQQAYAVFLKDYARDDVMGALKRLVASGQKFRPTPGEIVAAMRANTEKPRPSWAEVRATLSRVLHQRDEAKALKLADDAHPIIGGFVRTIGWQKMRMLPLEGPEYGELEWHRLHEQFDEYADVGDQRIARGIALGGGTDRGELERMDPLERLGVKPPTALPAPPPEPPDESPSLSQDEVDALWARYRMAGQPPRVGDDAAR